VISLVIAEHLLFAGGNGKGQSPALSSTGVQCTQAGAQEEGAGAADTEQRGQSSGGRGGQLGEARVALQVWQARERAHVGVNCVCGSVRVTDCHT
jgi:hypothetical protein